MLLPESFNRGFGGSGISLSPEYLFDKVAAKLAQILAVAVENRRDDDTI
ncbi:MAG: hypothetical protein PWP34_2519, partial [Desulfuromonadales bacterium]|nr:hypothetical protein [Desulfuromonadales bacterium]